MYAVTGATSHIGNVLVRKLAELDTPIRILVRKSSNLKYIDEAKVEKVFGDILDLDSLIKAFTGCDTVFHLAGIVKITPGDEELVMRVNLDGTKNVIEACKRACVKKLIYTSTIHAIKEPPKGTIIDETLPFDPKTHRGAYDRSKALASIEVEKATGEELETIIVCPTGVIGPYDFKPSYFGAGMISYTKKKQPFRIDGEYDYADVRDVADGIIKAAMNGRSGEKYILSGHKLTMDEYYSLLEDITGIKPPKTKIPFQLALFFSRLITIFSSNPYLSPYAIKILQSNSDISSKKAQRELGYKARNLKDSLSDQIKWFRENNMIK
jgi:dihydroflavonol-4-reductase